MLQVFVFILFFIWAWPLTNNISYTVIFFNIKRYCVYLKTIIICTRRLRTDIMQFTFFLRVTQKSGEKFLALRVVIE